MVKFAMPCYNSVNLSDVFVCGVVFIGVYMLWSKHSGLGCYHVSCLLFLILFLTLNHRKVMRVSVSYVC